VELIGVKRGYETQTPVERHAKDIQGVIECFDRVVLFGTYKSIGRPGAMEQPLRGRGTSFLEFNKSYANELRLEMAEHGRTLRRFRVLKLIKPVAGTRKYYPAARGESLVIAG
jgi:hypothetical protein